MKSIRKSFSPQFPDLWYNILIQKLLTYLIVKEVPL